LGFDFIVFCLTVSEHTDLNPAKLNIKNLLGHQNYFIDFGGRFSCWLK
jgi:hypothetical protein